MIFCTRIGNRFTTLPKEEKVALSWAIALIVIVSAVTLASYLHYTKQGALTSALKIRFYIGSALIGTITFLVLIHLFKTAIGWSYPSCARGPRAEPETPPSPPPREIPKLKPLPPFLQFPSSEKVIVSNDLLPSVTTFLTCRDQFALLHVNRTQYNAREKYAFHDKYQKMFYFHQMMQGRGSKIEELFSLTLWDRITVMPHPVMQSSHPDATFKLESPFNGEEDYWPQFTKDYTQLINFMNKNGITILAHYDIQQRATIIVQTPTVPLIISQRYPGLDSTWKVQSSLKLLDGTYLQGEIFKTPVSYNNVLISKHENNCFEVCRNILREDSNKYNTDNWNLYLVDIGIAFH